MCCRELVASVAQGGVVMITWCNFHYADFARNWVAHMRRLNITAYLVGAMDDQILQAGPPHLVQICSLQHLLASRLHLAGLYLRGTYGAIAGVGGCRREHVRHA